MCTLRQLGLGSWLLELRERGLTLREREVRLTNGPLANPGP